MADQSPAELTVRPHKKAILVAGDTLKVKEQLKAIGGGSWNRSLQGWIFPGSKKDAVVLALEAGKSTVKVESTDATDAAAASSSSCTAPSSHAAPS
eukprot:3433771-Prymnesium_polylepis.1